MWRNSVNNDFYEAPCYKTVEVGRGDHPRVHLVNPRDNETASTLSTPRRHFVGSLLLDILIIVFLFGLCGLFYFWNTPVPYFRLNDPRYSYPIMPELVSSIWMGIINWLIPLFILVFCEIFLFGWYKWNFIYVIKAYAETMVISLLLPSIIWAFYPSLRPNFYAVCNPNASLMQPIGGLWYTSAICQNKLKWTDLDGFPSGHASTAWSAWTFLAFYLWARLKPFDGTSHLWKVVFVFLIPFIIVMWECLSRLLDFHHSVVQIVWGSILGLLGVFIGYRMNHLGFPWNRYGHITTGHYLQNEAAKMRRVQS
jgi:membrane-associated phospholipid phosphatase